jgi:hypothetical protein
VAVFRPVSGPGLGSAVLAELARLWDLAAAQGQRPTQAQLARESGVPAATISDWVLGRALPRDAAQVHEAGAVLARWAGEAPAPVQSWEQMVEADRGARVRSGRGLGRWVSELSDPFALEIHRPVDAEGPAGLPALPPYVPREHDGSLAAVVAHAAAGASRLAVLVGGSSTGKTRACWEAVTLPGALPGGWRLWHPFDPTRPEALLDGLPQVGRQTVIWLNEAQLYLGAPGDAGERAAAGLRTLLADTGRAPVLVLGTLWPEFWDALTRSNTTISTLLQGTRIGVPAVFPAALVEVSAITLLSRGVAHVIDQVLVWFCSTGFPSCLSW